MISFKDDGPRTINENNNCGFFFQKKKKSEKSNLLFFWAEFGSQCHGFESAHVPATFFLGVETRHSCIRRVVSKLVIELANVIKANKERVKWKQLDSKNVGSFNYENSIVFIILSFIASLLIAY